MLVLGLTQIVQAHECMEKGSNEQDFLQDLKKVNGGDTGAFFREVFSENSYRKLNSCIEIPALKSSSAFQKAFSKESGDVPYAYLGAHIGSKDYEGGLVFDSVQNNFQLFSSNFTGQRMKFYDSPRFQPGDQVCLGLEYNKTEKALQFTVRSEGTTSLGKPLKDAFSDKEPQPLAGDKVIQFKRVFSLATRAPAKEKGKLGHNSGFDLTRMKLLKSQKKPWSGVWYDAYLIGYDAKISKITPKSYVYSKPGAKCTMTTKWPSQLFKVKQQQDKTTVEFL